jgi:erythronate-4-phosphate dehydrogenase
VRILVDENIPLAAELFGRLGDIVLAPGREVDADYPSLETFDALAIRSVTAVTPGLVDRAANCRFIGTATIGTDHIDAAYIERANARRTAPIAVASAPGSNADSVADHVWHAVCHLASGTDVPLAGRSLGIVGHGNCGSRVARRAAGFGMRVVRHDPPLAAVDPAFTSDPLGETLACDFVTLHVPLTREGQSDHPTYHMIDAAALAALGDDAVLINTSRGAVIDSAALIDALDAGAIGGAVLDVFEGEPEPPPDLLRLPLLVTPHIAGYATEAKRRGAVVVYDAMCRAFGVEPEPSRELLMGGFSPPRGAVIRFGAGGGTDLAADRAVRELMRATCDITATSRELKATLDAPERGAAFDRMRKRYHIDYGRHELSAYRVAIGEGAPADLSDAISRRLEGFGVEVSSGAPHYILQADQHGNGGLPRFRRQ